MGISHKGRNTLRTRGVSFNARGLEKTMNTPAEVNKSLGNRVGELESALSRVLERLNVLESGLPTPKDDISQKMIDFLEKFPGIKFNTGTIAANIDSNSMKISDKLKTLAQRGVIRSGKEDGQSAMYWVEPEFKVNTDVTYSGVTAQMEGE